jgi:hypothetical protein
MSRIIVFAASKSDASTAKEKKRGVLFCDTHTISSLLHLQISAKEEFKRSLSVSTDDLVIAATSYDVDLSSDTSGQLCEFLKSCFPSNCIVINGVVTHAVATSVTKKETTLELATPTSSFVFWLRLQLKIQEKGFSKESLREVRTPSDSCDGGSLLSLCVCLHENHLQSVCYGLRDHIVNGQFFGSESDKVLRFFQTLIHGYRFLHSNPGVFQPGIELISFISDVVAQMSPYPKDLKSHAVSVFQKYAVRFRYLKLICFVSDGSESQEYVLEFNDCNGGVGHWSSDAHIIKWTGKNWILLEKGSLSLIATQETGKRFSKSYCIPSLGCLQSSGSWILVSGCSYSRIQTQIADITPPIVSNTGALPSAGHRTSASADHLTSVAVATENPKPDQRPVKRLRLAKVDVSPSLFRLLLAAVRIEKMCKDSSSRAAFEQHISLSLKSFQVSSNADGDADDSLPSDLIGVEDVALKDRVGDLFSLLVEHESAGNTAPHTPSAFAAPSKKKGKHSTAEAVGIIGSDIDTAGDTALQMPSHFAAASPEISLAASASGSIFPSGEPSTAAANPVGIIGACAQSASTLSGNPSAPADATFGFNIVEAKFSCDHPATFLSFDGDGNLAVSCISRDSDAGKIEIRTFQNGNIISEPSFCVKGPFGFTFQSSSHLIVADPFSHCVRMFDYKDGSQTGKITCTSRDGSKKKLKPLSVAVDASGNIVVYCYLFKASCVQVYSQHLGFEFIRLVGSMSLVAGGAVAFDSNNNLVVSDDGGRRIRVVSYPNGDVIRTILIQCRPDSPSQRYIYCGGFVFDCSGHIFVANIADRSVNICDYSTGFLLHRICFRDAPGSRDDPGCLSVAMNDKEKMLIVCCGCDVYYYPMHLIMEAGTGPLEPPTIVQSCATALAPRGNSCGNEQPKPEESAVSASVHSSAAIYVATSFIGLRNFGLSCGTNACLQCLLHTMELKREFYASQLSGCDHIILYLFKAMVNIDQGYHCETVLQVLIDVLRVDILKKDRSKLAGDASEILLHLLEHIDPDRFKVTIRSQVSCLDCCTRSESTAEEYLSLSFPPASKNRNAVATLEGALKSFEEIELFDKENWWHCSSCSKQTRSEKKLFLENIPNFFFIHLKRFESEGRRINRNFEVPSEHRFGQSGVFRLYAAICHYPGGVGHFVAYCRPNPSQSWMLCDDSSVVAKLDTDVLRDIRQNGYVFFFQRQPTASVTAIAQGVSTCATLDIGLSLLNQLTLIADNHIDCSSVPQLCAKLQEMADDDLNPKGRSDTRVQDFISQCKHLAESIVQNSSSVAAAAQSSASNPKVASPAARCVHAFPYNFSMVKFDLGTFQEVEQEKALILFEEFSRQKTNTFIQYADDHYDEACPNACTKDRMAPNILHHENFMNWSSLEWFFQSIAALFPCVMILSSDLVNLKLQNLDEDKYQVFVQHVRDRRPRFVLHAVNAPHKPQRSLQGQGMHWILFFITFNWTQAAVSSIIEVLDPFSNIEYIRPVASWYQEKRFFDSFNPVFQVDATGSVPKIQRGEGNHHCGVFVMALALNKVLGTLEKIGQVEYFKDVGSSGTNSGGLELRKYVAWDCTQYPPLLDTSLLMCPLFTPISNRRIAVQAHKWWVVSQYHNIADILTLKGFSGGVFVAVNPRIRRNQEIQFPSSFAMGRTIVTDGPWFFKNSDYFVKVHCIGLIGHALPDDHIAIKRASNAFREACASQYVCQKEGWFCESFGLICVGLVCPCAFVCVVRKLGAALQDTSASDVGSFFHSRTLHWLHVEPHRGHMMLVDEKQEAIDLAQAFFTSVRNPIPLSVYSWYANSIAENGTNHHCLQELMPNIESSLGATLKFFSDFYTRGNFLQLAFTGDLFQKSTVGCWEYDPFCHLFELLDSKNMHPKLDQKNTIEFVGGSIRFNRNGGSFQISSHESLPVLSCASDTKKFIEAILTLPV